VSALRLKRVSIGILKVKKDHVYSNEPRSAQVSTRQTSFSEQYLSVVLHDGMHGVVEQGKIGLACCMGEALREK